MIRLGIVEDVPEMRALLAECVRGIAGFDVAWEAANVPEARLLLGRWKPDGLLLDEVLPGLPGSDLLPDLRAAGVPVVLLSGVSAGQGRGAPPEGLLRLEKPHWRTLGQDRERFRAAFHQAFRA